MEVRRTPDHLVVKPVIEIQTPLQYAADFVREARHARERVWLQAMLVQTNHASSLMFNAVHNAAERGLDARLTYDAYSQAERDGKLLILPTGSQTRTQQREIEKTDKEWHKKLKEAGVNVVVTNPSKLIKLFSVFGRNHMKITIVDGIAWFGGVNPASNHFERADFMVKITAPEIVDALADVFFQVNENKPQKDYKKEISDDYTLLVDRGDRGKSIILDEAISMIGDATESVRYISQLLPEGKVLDKLLERAKTGVEIDIISQSLSHLNSNSIPFGLLMKHSYRKFLKATEGYSNIHLHHFDDNQGMVHAKMVLTDAETDKAKALWGSHNLHISGVRAGTQEASLKTTDVNLVLKLAAVFEQIKNKTFDLGYQEGRFNPQGFIAEV